jgi:hypothetical protein
VREEGLGCYATILELFTLVVKQKIIKNYPRSLVKAFASAPFTSLVKSHLNKELEVSEDILEKAIEMIWLAVKA